VIAPWGTLAQRWIAPGGGYNGQWISVTILSDLNMIMVRAVPGWTCRIRGLERQMHKFLRMCFPVCRRNSKSLRQAAMFK